jgi:hypothetical protein
VYFTTATGCQPNCSQITIIITTSKDPFLVCTVIQRREFFVLYYAILVLEFRKQWIPRSVKIAHTEWKRVMSKMITVIDLTATALTRGGSSTVHIYTQKNTQKNTMRQNKQNGTYITVRILKLTQHVT